MYPRKRNHFGSRRIFLTLFTAFLTLVATVAFFPGVAAQTVCESPYIVQEGDTLSKIATRCDTTEQALLDANPAIVNQRLIYPGQRLTIPGSATIPNTGAQAELQLNQDSGPAGTLVTVTGSGFPAGATVRVGQGAFGSEPVQSREVQTNDIGSFSTQFMIPVNADTQLSWIFMANPLTGSGPTVTTDFNVTAPSTTNGQRYIVQNGDTLSEIAASFGTSVQALMRANPQIEDASLIFPGQELVIPVAVNIIPNTGQTTYIVQGGDTLGEIAVRFNSTIQALLDANPTIQDADLIYAGQSLVIPGTGGS